MTCALRRVPRRNGVSTSAVERRSLAGMTIRAILGAACAEGSQASRTTPRTLRRPVFASTRRTRAVSLSRTRCGSSRETWMRRGDPAMIRSIAVSTTTSPSQAASTQGSPMIASGMTPIASSRTNQPEMAMG